MKSRFLPSFAALVFAAALLAGCSTTADSENVSSRPWNAPQGWSGLPSGINDGR